MKHLFQARFLHLASLQLSPHHFAQSLNFKGFFKFFLEFATLIKAEVGSSSSIEHKATVEDDPKRRRPDIRLAKKVLDWEPKVS